TVEYTTAGPCPATSIQTVNVLPGEEGAFNMTPTCNGASAIITGDMGGTFAFNPEPGDGATINPSTGEITNGVSGTTYTVEYTTAGPCPNTTSVIVVLLASTEDASFIVNAITCSGAT